MRQKVIFSLTIILAGVFVIGAVYFASAQTNEEPVDNYCEINQSVFGRDWKKYSEINDLIPLESRSVEAQRVNSALSKIVEKRLEIFFLKRDMEIDRQMRVSLRDYRLALIQNIKVNLLKSFWRLAYIAFDTIHGTPGLGEGAIGTGKSFVKIFSDDAVPIQRIGSALKFLRDLTPGDSRLAIDTQKIRGKVQAVGTTAALEVLDNLGDPQKAGAIVIQEVGKAVTQEIAKQTLPSADITPEEMEILRTQHLNRRALDDAMQQSYFTLFARLDRIKRTEAEIVSLQKEADEWGQKEKERIASLLQRTCRENKEKSKEREKSVESSPAKPSTVAPTPPQKTGTSSSCQKEYDVCADNRELLIKQYFKRQKEIVDAGNDIDAEPYRSELEQLWEQKDIVGAGCIDQYITCCKAIGVKNPSRNRNYCEE